MFFAFELSLLDNFLRQNLHMYFNAALFILNTLMIFARKAGSATVRFHKWFT